MWFVMLAVVLIALKLFDVGMVAMWPWWWVLSPLPLAVVWWWWADFSGYTKRHEMDRMEEKKVDRRRKSLEALGLDHRAFDKQKKSAAAFKQARQREIDKVEGKRDEKRKRHRDSILHSRFDSKHPEDDSKSPDGGKP